MSQGDDFRRIISAENANKYFTFYFKDNNPNTKPEKKNEAILYYNIAKFLKNPNDYTQNYSRCINAIYFIAWSHGRECICPLCDEIERLMSFYIYMNQPSGPNSDRYKKYQNEFYRERENPIYVNWRNHFNTCCVYDAFCEFP